MFKTFSAHLATMRLPHVPPPPARIGANLAEIDTPALLVELPAFERNLAAMAAFARAATMRLRPHAKTHKSATIAKRQMAAGAVGVCCQKASEAEALVRGGVTDVFVSNEVVHAHKLERLAALAQAAHIGIALDNVAAIEPLANAARRHEVTLDVYIEIDVGQHRCGVAPGAAAVELAKRVAHTSSLRFAGLQAYHGGAQHKREPVERREAIARAAAAAHETKAALEASGIACPIVTGAGTGTFANEAASGVYNELQVGSYVFMDADYARNTRDEHAPQFEQGLFVLAGVMSVAPGRAVVDAGLKASSVDSGLPIALARGWTYASASDEHGVLSAAIDATPLALGDTVKLVPGHCDPTVNLYDWYVVVKDERVVDLWPIEARGCVW